MAIAENIPVNLIGHHGKPVEVGTATFVDETHAEIIFDDRDFVQGFSDLADQTLLMSISFRYKAPKPTTCEYI